MKPPVRIFLGLAFVVLAFAACHKDASTTPSPVTTPVTNKLSFQLDGTTYTATNLTAIDSTGTFYLTGVISNATTVYFTSTSGAKVGSYAIAGGAAAVTFVAGGVFNATSGTVTVSTVTGTNIAGTFNFITTNAAGDTTAVVTNGTFQTSYTNK